MSLRGISSCLLPRTRVPTSQRSNRVRDCDCTFQLRATNWLRLIPIIMEPKRRWDRELCTAQVGYDHSRIYDIRKSGKVGETVTLKGWVKTVRAQKANLFIEVNDGSSIANIQVVADPSMAQDLPLSTGASIEVVGKLAASPAGEASLELQPSSIRVLGTCDSGVYPMAKKKHTFEFLRDNAHLRPRGNTFAAVMRVRNAATMAIHNFFQREGFINVHTPIISGNDCEGAGELFMVSTRQKVENEQLKPAHVKGDKWNSFFSVEEAYLTVSGQLQAEIFACSMGRVYTFGPTFRAEKSNTPRHLAEFWMVEPEVAFLDLDGDIKLAERFIKSVVGEIAQQCAEDIKFFAKWIDPNVTARIESTLKEDFVRLEYADAIDILNKANMPIQWGSDFERQHERYLCEEHFKKPVFVINWPKEIKPFYMKLNPDGKTVACMDLLVPRIGEVIGGSQREDNYDLLVQRMKDMNLSVENNQWYLDLRKYGSVPHAGFGLGFERLLLYMTGMENIRDVIPIPRHPGYCKF